MHNAFGNHKEFASSDHLRRLSLNIHGHFAFKDIEEIVSSVMLVKWILTFEFHDHDIVIVVVGHNMWVPMTCK